MSRRLLASRPVAVTLALAVVFAAWSAWAHVAGARKLTPAEIARAGDLTGDAARLDIEVVLPFTPEQFHFLRLQEIGRMAGASESSVRLRGVPVEEARRLARRYWVADIEPLEPQ
jgi:hypothetical protein